MTPVEAILRRQIAQTGPVPLAEFMSLCLAHPDHGYYRSRDPLGAGGDFTTAPEISQMFGELVGLALAAAWYDARRPERPLIAELGPGRGTLMADALRAAGQAAPDFARNAQVWLVETSPALQSQQAKRVPTANWAEAIDDLPDGPLFLIANEFFDALPISQAIRAGGVWRERVVGLESDRLAWGLGKPAAGPNAAEGSIRETSPQSQAIARAVGARIAERGGAALIIDYGYAETPPEGGDTFQAVRDHSYVDPLASPGEADLTAHVDFAALAAAARSGGAATSGPVTQGAWLARMGVGARAEALVRAKPEESAAIAAALRRLTHGDEMGTLFKVLAIHGETQPPPPGFDAQ